MPEQRQALRQIRGRLMQPDKGFGVADVGRVGVDALTQGLPQRLLPGQVVG